MLNQISSHYKIKTPLLRSFWDNIPKEPINDWKILANDFFNYINRQGKTTNNIGIGHSIGGTLLFYSAIVKPELFSKIILLDPVIFSSFKCKVWSIIKAMGLGMYFHPLAKKALYRKKIFISKKEIFHRYRKKQIFSNFTDESLKIYIDSIIKKHNDCFVLNFSSKVESDIYLSGLTLENIILKQFNKIKSKIYILYADKDSTISTSTLNLFSKSNKIEQYKIDGLSHLFPMEDSNRVYMKIRDILT